MSTELPYYLPSEVIIHNKVDDFWVTFLGRVYDLTPLIKEYKNKKVVKPLLAYAGKDISHWFDRRTNNMKFMVHSITGVQVPYAPHGALPHFMPQVPSVSWRPLEAQFRPVDGKPWWLDDKYLIGHLTKKSRPLRLINTLLPHSHSENLVWVASEERMNQMLQRFLPHNSKTSSYVFKFRGRELDLDKRLDENGIEDEREKYLRLGMTDDNYVPAIKLYFKDDFR